MPRPAPVAPIAAARPHVVESPNGDRTDEYYWLRDDTRTDQDVLAYLEAENAYKARDERAREGARGQLYEEIVARIKQDDSTVPYRLRGYWYYTRFETGREYPIYARKAGTLDAPEEVMLDGNALADGHDFFQIGASAMSRTVGCSPTPRTPSAAASTRSASRISRPARRSRTESTNVEAASPGQRTTGPCSTSRRTPRRCCGYASAGTCSARTRAAIPLVYVQEDDELLHVGRHGSKDERYILIHAREHGRERMALCRWPAIRARIQGLPAARARPPSTSVEHLDGRWIIRTNWQAPNFRLMEVERRRRSRPRALARRHAASRRRLRPGLRRVQRISSRSSERSAALRKIRIRPSERRRGLLHRRRRAAYTMSLGQNAGARHRARPLHLHVADHARHRSTTTTSAPASAQLLKREPVLGDFDPARLRDRARLGDRARRHEGAGLARLSQGHSARRHGAAAAVRLRLLRRVDGSGVLRSRACRCSTAASCYAIAHVRGGQELGRRWYEDGRLLNKKNTFTDFIDVTRYLVAEGYARSEARVRAMGGSAGGLLMGAIANMAPERLPRRSSRTCRSSTS